MANSIINLQLSIPSSIKSPVVSGSDRGARRLTFLNLAKLIWNSVSGRLNGLSGTESYLQVQQSVVCASATATPAAVQNADTVTIAGTALTATQRRASGTITFAASTAADTITLNGVVFTAVNGAVTPGEATFDVSGNDTADAASFVSQLAAYSDARINGIVASKSSAAVVTVYAVTQGTAGNAITLASSNGTRLAVSGATLANGAAIANNTFDFAGSNVTTGQALAAAINASTTAAVQQTVATASSSTGVVTVTSKMGGVAGNTIAFVSSNGTRLAVTGSGFLASGAQGAATRFLL